MFSTFGISLLCFLVSLGNACVSKSGASQNSAPGNGLQTASAATTNPAEVKSEAKSEAGPASSTGFMDACALIKKSEIASVQGMQVQQMQPTNQQNGDLDISQCYYTAISADGSKNFSVFIQVIQSDSNRHRRNAVKELWEERFEAESKEQKKAEEEDEEAIAPPLRVSEVGDKAVWLGSSRGARPVGV
jgi:hypothetical protein